MLSSPTVGNSPKFLTSISMLAFAFLVAFSLERSGYVPCKQCRRFGAKMCWPLLRLHWHSLIVAFHPILYQAHFANLNPTLLCLVLLLGELVHLYYSWSRGRKGEGCESQSFDVDQWVFCALQFLNLFHSCFSAINDFFRRWLLLLFPRSVTVLLLLLARTLQLTSKSNISDNTYWYSHRLSARKY